jgi:hypothetical protein
MNCELVKGKNSLKKTVRSFETARVDFSMFRAMRFRIGQVASYSLQVAEMKIIQQMME